MSDERNPPEGLQSSFPQSPSAFDADERISFSKLDSKYLLETEEGTEFEWDDALRRWIPVVGYIHSALLVNLLQTLSLFSPLAGC